MYSSTTQKMTINQRHQYYHLEWDKDMKLIHTLLTKNRQNGISSKIMESTNQLCDNHKLTLLYRHSRDSENFRKLCNHKGPTIAVGKVSDTDEILGGSVSTESFIFALDKSIEKSIVSFVDDTECAIYDHYSYFPAFGNGFDLFFGFTIYSSLSLIQISLIQILLNSL